MVTGSPPTTIIRTSADWLMRLQETMHRHGLESETFDVLTDMPWPVDETIRLWLMHYPSTQTNPEQAHHIKDTLVQWHDQNRAFFGHQWNRSKAPLWFLSRIPEQVAWSMIPSIARNMLPDASLETLQDWGNLLCRKLLMQHMACGVILKACTSASADWVVRMVYAASKGVPMNQIGHPYTWEQPIPPVLVEQVKIAVDMGFAPEAIVRHALANGFSEAMQKPLALPISM